MLWLNILWNTIVGNLPGIVTAITGTIGKLSDNDTARLKSAIGAEKDVVVAQLQASAAAYHDRAALLYGMSWVHFLIFATLAPCIWHHGLVILDSSPLIPGLGDGWLPGIVEHKVGSWKVAALPGDYSSHEWQLIMALLGVQSALVGGGSFLRWLGK